VKRAQNRRQSPHLIPRAENLPFLWKFIKASFVYVLQSIKSTSDSNGAPHNAVVTTARVLDIQAQSLRLAVFKPDQYTVHSHTGTVSTSKSNLLSFATVQTTSRCASWINDRVQEPPPFEVGRAYAYYTGESDAARGRMYTGLSSCVRIHRKT
jgi:hypothetical protein